jgi:hypothetical protein
VFSKARSAIILLALGLVCLATPADAGTCSITDHPASGALSAARFNERYAQIENCINGNIGNANIATAEPIALTNLQNQKAIYAVSFTIADEDGDATAGEDLAATTDVRNFRVPVSSTVIGMSIGVRCPSDVTGTPGDCAGAAVTVTLQEDANTIKTFAGVATNTVQVDFALNTSITNTDVLNIDTSGTFTDVDFIDVVIYLKASHQT